MGKYHCTVDLLFDWFGISCMTAYNFCFYLQNRLIQASQTGGQWYSDTSTFNIPWLYQICPCLAETFSQPTNFSSKIDGFQAPPLSCRKMIKFMSLAVYSLYVYGPNVAIEKVANFPIRLTSMARTTKANDIFRNGKLCIF
jgi:hypothetical protein